MKRTRCVRGGFAAVLLAGGLCMAGAAPVTAESSSLKQCVNETEALSVLFLVDTSASLRRTDPDDKRVIGLKLALAALATRRDAQSGAKAVPVYVDFLSFGTKTTRTFTANEWPEWGEIPSDPDVLISQMDKFANEDSASDTDYVSALDPYPSGRTAVREQIGALEHLDAAPTSCRLLVWFTDGQLDFDPPASGRPPKELSWTDLAITNESTALEAAARGTERLCEPGGPTDRLRSGSIGDSGEGAQLAVVALGENLADFDLISRIAEGNCGTKETRGKIYPANDVNGLIGNLLEATLGEGDGPRGGDITTCEGSSCSKIDESKIETFDYPFTLTAGIDSFNLIALKGDERITSVLISPDGQQVSIDDLGDQLTMNNGTQLKKRSFPSAPNVQHLRAKLGDNPNSWAGEWRLRFKTSNAAAARLLNRVTLYVYPGELQLNLREPKIVRRGRTSSVIVEFVTASGRIIAKPEFMPEPELTVTAGDTEVDPGALRADGTWQFDYEVPADLQEDQLEFDADLVLKAQIDKNRDPIELDTWSFDNFGVVEVRDTPKYPLLDAPIAPFDKALSQNRTRISTTFVIEAPADVESGGCVELIDVTSAVDPDKEIEGSIVVTDGGTEVSVGDPCALEIQTGEQRILTIEMEIDGDDVTDQRTSLTGSLSFRTTSAVDPKESNEYQKTVTASVVPEFVTDTDWFRVVLLTLLAVLGPFVILYVLNFLNRRIDVGPGAVVTIPVKFADGRMYRRSGTESSELTITDDDLDIVGMPSPGGYRSVDAGGVEFAGAMPWSPLADTYGIARSKTAQLVIANHGTDPKHTEIGRLGPTLRGAWVFQSDSLPEKNDDKFEPINGVLTLIVPTDPDSARTLFAEHRQQIEDLLDQTCRRLAVDLSQEQTSAANTSSSNQKKGPFDEISPAVEAPTAGGPIDPFTGQVLPSQIVDPIDSKEAKRSRRWGRQAESSDNQVPPTPPNPPNLPF